MTERAFPQVTLSTARLVLRPFQLGDAADVLAVWHDHAYLQYAPVGLPTAEADIERARTWCATDVEEQRRAGQGVGFAVAPRGGGRLVGHVALFGVNWTTMVADIHYWTAPWARGHGYATEAVRALVQWALTEQGLVRVTLRAVADNVASRRVAAAAGFPLEGILRSAALTRAGRGDFAVYGLVASDLATEAPDYGGTG